MVDLYRHFDADGRLLYVGVSLCALMRLRQHQGSSHWAGSIASITIEKFPDRHSASAAEMRAIEWEKPAHNIVGARRSHPPVRWHEWGARHPDWWADIEDMDRHGPKFTAIWCGHIASAGCLDAPL